MDFLQELNKDQRKAVEAEGPVIIIAGPGTGKTKTLVARIRYLVEKKNISPEKILAVTFTKKASAEMKERLITISEDFQIYTFHGLAHGLLKANKINHIISEVERLAILQQISERNSINVTKKELQELSLEISNSKNNIEQQSNTEVISLYNHMLKERNLIDYDDLLLQLYNSLKIGNKRKFKYILVDEFQDTNKLQYEILKLLLVDSNIFVIGDPLQSIYSFRGASATIFKQFSNDFPFHHKITLTTNYRSDEEIINASSSLFLKRPELIPFSKENGEVLLINTLNEFTEAEWIVNSINTLIGGTDLLKSGNILSDNNRKLNFKDFAIIYRTHSFSRVLEHVFVKSGIPFQIIGDNGLFVKPEIAFIVSVLRYVYVHNVEYLHDLLISSLFCLAPSTKKQLSQLYRTNKDSYYIELQQNIHLYISVKKDMKIVSTFLNEIKHLLIELKNLNIVKFIHKIVQIKVLRDYINSKALNPIHIHTLISVFTQFNADENSLEKSIEYLHFLEDYEFYDPTIDKVTLLSIHAAKGLEFSSVYIVGFEQGIIPFEKKDEIINIEEERRLLYVAMTRAKHTLHLISSNYRNKQKTLTSQFRNNLKSFKAKEDEVIQRQEKQIKKIKEKKSQLTLF